MKSISNIRDLLVHKFYDNNFVIDKSGVKTIELVGESFVASSPAIFGEPNDDYIKREIQWYESCSLNVNDIPGGPPKIWQQVATPEGWINSNYGWCIWHPDNGMQYEAVKMELIKNPFSRRAQMIYTRPTMHMDYNECGKSDFMCTSSVSYLIRDNVLNSVVQMRSNDLFHGYRNDVAWQYHVLNKLSKDLEIDPGYIIWNASSAHIYERHFYLVDHFNKTGKISITKKQYRELYPDSEWN